MNNNTKRQPVDPATYSPLSWRVREERPGVFEATNLIDGSALRVFAYPNGEFRTWGEDRESLHNVDQMLGCDCADFEHRALTFGRLCRHGAACCAVEGFIALEQRAERKRAARADIDQVFSNA